MSKVHTYIELEKLAKEQLLSCGVHSIGGRTDEAVVIYGVEEIKKLVLKTQTQLKASTLKKMSEAVPSNWRDSGDVIFHW